MQQRKTQAERRAETQRALVSAARQLFADKGYADTGTPEIVALAGVTRGALYHHFADKLALFAAVVGQEQLMLAMESNAAAAGADDTGPVKALVAYGEACVAAMQAPGRRQILLIDAPAVLRQETLKALQAARGSSALTGLVRGAIAAKAIRDLPAETLAALLQALFDRAAQAAPEALTDYRKTIKALIRGLKD
ncbi:MAG: TetR/AcrR family transcriptional regulator [Devosia sp.]